MKIIRRKQLLVDGRVQGGLAAKLVFYWFCMLLAVLLIGFCWRLLTGPGGDARHQLLAVGRQLIPVLIGSLLLLPMLIVDALRWSNRYAGPALRIRTALKTLAQGQQIQPILLRKDDFWSDAAEALNQLAQRSGQLSQQRDENEPDGVESDQAACAV